MNLGIATNEILISVISGALVALAIELISQLKQKRRRKKEIKYIQEVFMNAYAEIKKDISIPQVGLPQIRFVRFKAFLTDFRNVTYTHSMTLTPNEKFELLKFIDETINFMEWLPAPPVDLKPYEMFFERIEKMTWLNFRKIEYNK